MALDTESPTKATLGKTTEGLRLPPGPGANLLMSVLKQKKWVDPLAHFVQLAANYGDIAHYKLGRRHIVFLNHPEYIREVFVVQHANFIKERTQQRARLLLGEGMITADGARHKQQRQAAAPAFHRQKMSAHADEIVRRAAALRDQWSDGEAHDVHLEMMTLGMGIIGATVFRTDLGEEVHELNHAMADIMNVYNAVVLLPGIRLLLQVPFTPLRKFVHARKKLHQAVDCLIDEHRKRGADASGTDLLSMLLDAQKTYGWSDEHVRDQVVTVILAGYETTAIALTWTWYLLSQNPAAEARMHDELDRVLGDRLPGYDDLRSYAIQRW
jgi:cytochrome P450